MHCSLFLLVLLVGNLFHPVNRRTVKFFLYGDVAHGCSCCCTVPVLFVWLNQTHIAGVKLFYLAAFALYPAATGLYNQGLPKRMRMPCGTRPRLESNQC